MKVFSKEKYLTMPYGKSHYDLSLRIGGKSWIDTCDGKEVVFNHNNGHGTCGGYYISAEWCIDVPDKPTKPKMHILIDCDDGKTTTARLIVDGKEVKKAIARLNPDDEFNFRIGSQTAFNRLWEKKKKPVKEMGKHQKIFNDEMAKFIKLETERIFRRFDKLPLAVREVKRHAKPGEWVKIVKAYGHPNETYKTGDVLRVEEMDGEGWVYLEGRNECACAPDEYVVLEGYKGGGGA